MITPPLISSKPNSSEPSSFKHPESNIEGGKNTYFKTRKVKMELTTENKTPPIAMTNQTPSIMGRSSRSSFYLPENPSIQPTYNETIARAFSLDIQDLLESSHYTSAIKIWVTKENDWNKLCEFNDYVEKNIINIIHHGHQWTACKLANENPNLHRWLMNHRREEIKSKADPEVQFQTISLDWSATHFIPDDDKSRIPENYFHWRNLAESDFCEAPSNIQSKPMASRKRKAADCGVTIEEPIRLIAEGHIKSMRLDKQSEFLKKSATYFLEHLASEKKNEYQKFITTLGNTLDQYQERYEKMKSLPDFKRIWDKPNNAESTSATT
ncbi:hypothetical protein [Endozoicomonas ascidiicola]|uniref:hypothetical protein n=1 Tax=Endozoicomonas ascidiicola TaxID=1698521 RepID=UPI00082D1559|nr:hypothetical protein [Endozoicomonas ascidiicola]